MKKIKKILPVLLGVMVLMFGTLTVSASETVDYDAIAKKIGVTAEYPYYFVMPRSNAIEYHFSNVPFISNVTGSNLGLTTSGNITTYTYYTDGSYKCDLQPRSWTGYPNWMMTGSSNKIDILYTSHDIWFPNADKENDKPVFRGPAPLVAVAEGLPVVVRERTTVILTTAVVCLALLVILSVLPKKLPRFLNR